MNYKWEPEIAEHLRNAKMEGSRRFLESFALGCFKRIDHDTLLTIARDWHWPYKIRTMASMAAIQVCATKGLYGLILVSKSDPRLLEEVRIAACEMSMPLIQDVVQKSEERMDMQMLRDIAADARLPKDFRKMVSCRIRIVEKMMNDEREMKENHSDFMKRMKFSRLAESMKRLPHYCMEKISCRPDGQKQIR